MAVAITRRRSSIGRRVLMTVLAACMVAMPALADAVHSENSKGNKLYKKGAYGEALQHYDNALKVAPKDRKLRMNRGAALYQLNRYDKADSEYVSPEALAKDKKALGDFYYNRGNILFRQAQQSELSGGQNAQELYKAALENYIKTLDQRPQDTDAKWNLQLAQARLQKLQQQQQQQQKQDNKKDQQKQQNQQGQNQQDQQKQQQGQQKQDQQQKQEQQDKQTQQQQQQQAAQDKEEQMKKQEAARIIEQFSDEANNLNKPMRVQIPKDKRMEKDW